MKLSQMQYYKQQKGYSYAKLSELSGVPVGTIQKIFCGETKNPRYETLQALEKVLLSEKESVSYSDLSLGRADSVCEPSAYRVEEPERRSTVFRKMGPYTLEDYYALPDEQWVELIDGYFFEMQAPTTIHQIVALDIFVQIKSYIKANKGNCIPFAAPVDVQLDCDDRTMVQPDVLVVCDKSKVIKRCVMGAPDFAVEVVSPSTKRKDALTKLVKYQEAGVREFWLVDAEKQKIVTYFYEEDEFPNIYGFSDRIPVKIYDGDLEIDFSEILTEIEGL